MAASSKDQRGIVVYLLDSADGKLRLTFDDVHRRDDEEWRVDCFFTHVEVDPALLTGEGGDRDLAERIGENLLLRLGAFRGKGMKAP